VQVIANTTPVTELDLSCVQCGYAGGCGLAASKATTTRMLLMNSQHVMRCEMHACLCNWHACLQVPCAVLDVLGQLGGLQEVQPEGRPSLTVATPAAIALPSGPTTFFNASSAILLNYSSPSPASLLPCSSLGAGTDTFQSCFVSAKSLQVCAYPPCDRTLPAL
jgi:hypothetical protein